MIFCSSDIVTSELRLSDITGLLICSLFFFQAEDGIRDLVRSRGLGDVYKRQALDHAAADALEDVVEQPADAPRAEGHAGFPVGPLSLIHI